MSLAPVGVVILSKIFGFTYENRRKVVNQVSVLALTFVAYAILHACRKALPVVKNKLHGNCTDQVATCPGGFKPFDSLDGPMYFAILDSSWAFSYSIGMFFMGYAAEKTSTKFFAVTSLLGTGLTTCALGLGYYLDIHNLWYYVVVQVLNGIIQSGGWPSIIPIVSSWIPKRTMGTILGIWGNHYAVGNMIGQLIAAAFVTSCWGMSFMVNGIIAIFVSLVLFLFLASNPKCMGFEENQTYVAIIDILSSDNLRENINDERSQISGIQEETPIDFFHALLLPGVLEFAFSLFFCKIVIYTFLFWLPYYLNAVGIDNYTITPSAAGFMAILFDAGGIIGNISIGYLMDLSGSPGSLCLLSQLCSCIAIYFFSSYAHAGYYICVALLMVTGLFTNAPHSLITGTISATLGDNEMTKDNKRATSTVTAIIDGTGCLGAAISPIVVVKISNFGWNYVMIALVCSCALSGLLLVRLVINELRCIMKK